MNRKVEDKNNNEFTNETMSENDLDSTTDSNKYKSIKIEEKNKKLEIYPEKNSYPYCIVWTHLPLISWILPFIGHTGICDSNGKIYDFAGSQYIGEDELSFGNPMKYVKFKPCQNWDLGIEEANNKYVDEEHDLISNNCHSHVAYALNKMKYDNKQNYNMIKIWWYCLIYSRYVSWSDIIKNYIGLIIIAIAVTLIITLS